MLEGIVIFAVGYVCGKYTDQVKAFVIKMINKCKKQKEETIEQ